MCTKDIYKRGISDVFVYILSYSTKSRYEFMSRRRLAFNNFALRYEKNSIFQTEVEQNFKDSSLKVRFQYSLHSLGRAFQKTRI